MPQDDPTTCYLLTLEMIEREPALSDECAIELLHSEFQRALNAAYFNAMAAGDVAVSVIARRLPQEGVACFDVALEFDERVIALSDEGAAELLQREFRRAINALHFWRVCIDELRVTVVARMPAEPSIVLRAGV